MSDRRETTVVDTDGNLSLVGRCRITGSEWRWAWVLALAVVAISCVPYLAAWISTPPGYQFGGLLVNPGDANTYLSKMRQGWFGSWQFHVMHTPELHDGSLLLPLLYFSGTCGSSEWMASDPCVPCGSCAKWAIHVTRSPSLYRPIHHELLRAALSFLAGGDICRVWVARDHAWHVSDRYMGARSLCILQPVDQSALPTRAGFHADHYQTCYLAVARNPILANNRSSRFGVSHRTALCLGAGVCHAGKLSDCTAMAEWTVAYDRVDGGSVRSCIFGADHPL